MCRPSWGRATGLGGPWCVWCLCGVCVLVGAWRCGVCPGAVVRGAASLRSSPWCPPLLRYHVVLCWPWLVAMPPLRAHVLRSSAGYLSSSFCVAAFFTLSSTLCWSALLPGVHFSQPHLRPCVCFSIFPCLLPRFLGPLLPLLLDPVRQRKGGGVNCCGVGGRNDDMRTWLAVVGVCVVAAAVSPNVACACVAVSWFFSLPLVRRWGPMRACVGVGCLVPWPACTSPLLLLVGTGHTSCSSCMRVFSPGPMHSYQPFFFPRCWRPLRASSLPSRLSPLVVDLCPVGCGGAWVVVSLCLLAHGGRCAAYSFPPLLYSVPSLVSGAVLACSRSCGSFVGRSLVPVLHTWWPAAPSVLLCTYFLLPLLSPL